MTYTILASNIVWDASKSKAAKLPDSFELLCVELDHDVCLQSAGEDAFLEWAADRYNFCISSVDISVVLEDQLLQPS